ncbi:hypothetical protein NC653_024350 [Populus alba x Populus x berolinensis]|uniref:Uncharacterized protein n=1 Tax=Populus alba x Populus x berolinensis TaxID=444605 RepID=A0AAD6M8N7_9ROSI|nr:hypothetical protein NC653_024350 [Populus alba x Populus x berolinensis]
MKPPLIFYLCLKYNNILFLVLFLGGVLGFCKSMCWWTWW